MATRSPGHDAPPQEGAPRLEDGRRLGLDVPAVVFDGDCGFCSHSVVFVLEREREPALHFVSSSSETGRRLLAAHGLEGAAASTMVLLEGGVATLRSTAALRLAARLRAPWCWARVLLWVPAFLRDLAYRAVAGVRLFLPGDHSVCRRPEPSWTGRLHH